VRAVLTARLRPGSQRSCLAQGHPDCGAGMGDAILRAGKSPAGYPVGGGLDRSDVPAPDSQGCPLRFICSLELQENSVKRNRDSGSSSWKLGGFPGAGMAKSSIEATWTSP
jgi:hypothetical protein